MKIAFLLPVKGQPRHYKRIRGLQDLGNAATAYYFNRPYFEGHEPPCPYECIGNFRHRKYLKRLFQICFSSVNMKQKLKDVDVIYAFGLDMALLSLTSKLFQKPQLIYEIGDLRPIQFERTIKGRIVRFLDGIVCKLADEVVVTAEGFAKFLQFHHKISADKIRIIENKLDLPASKRLQPKIHQPNRPVTIGYFGLLRCSKTWEALKCLSKNEDIDIQVYIRGYALGMNIEQEANQNPRIYYGGEYIAPDELGSLYEKVDIVWGCFPFPENHHHESWKWARTNRFYESCYFRRPIITLKNTDESNIVEKLGIGVSIDLIDPENAADELVNSLPKLLAMEKTLAALPDHICMTTDEHKNLYLAMLDRQACDPVIE